MVGLHPNPSNTSFCSRSIKSKIRALNCNQPVLQMTELSIQILVCPGAELRSKDYISMWIQTVTNNREFMRVIGNSITLGQCTYIHGLVELHRQLLWSE